MRIRVLHVAMCITVLLSPSVIWAAEDLNSRLDRLDAEIKRQGEIIREQQQTIAILKEELSKNKSQASSSQIQEVSAPAPKATGFFGSGVLNNPNISLVVDTYANASSLSNDELEERGIPGFTTNGLEQRQGFNLRAAELFLFAPVDPYFNLYVNLPFTEDGVELEEAFAVTTSLPAGFQLKGGKFKSNFSRLDAQHPHAWDFFDIALPYRAFLGDEGLGGEKGIQLTYLPDLPIYTLFGAEVLQGENDLLFGADAESAPHAFSLFVKNSVEITDNSTLYFGPSVLFGKTRNSSIIADAEVDGDSALFSMEGLWKWEPNSREGFTLQSEYLYLAQNGDITDSITTLVDSLDRRQDGFYVQGVYRTGRWRFGGRYDMMELFAKSFERADMEQNFGDTPWRATGAVELNLTEFTRMRLQFNHEESGFDDESNDEGILQFIFGIGAHAAHPF